MVDARAGQAALTLLHPFALSDRVPLGVAPKMCGWQAALPPPLGSDPRPAGSVPLSPCDPKQTRETRAHRALSDADSKLHPLWDERVPTLPIGFHQRTLPSGFGAARSKTRHAASHEAYVHPPRIAACPTPVADAREPSDLPNGRAFDTWKLPAFRWSREEFLALFLEKRRTYRDRLARTGLDSVG